MSGKPNRRFVLGIILVASLGVKPAFACVTDSDCDDGLFCNGSETCDPVLDCQAGSNPCGGATPVCNEAADRCVDCLVDADCDDGLFCNGAEVCDATLDCQVGSSPCTNPPLLACDEVNDVCRECLTNSDCDDGVVCTVDDCDEVTGGCTHTSFRYGDMNHDGIIDVFDLFCLVNGFSDNFTECSFEDVDIEPCLGNGLIDVFDLFAVINAFSGDDPCCGG